MHIVKRDYFGWPESNAKSANPQSGVVLHYDGPGRNLSKKTHIECSRYWKQVRSDHMNRHGWADIGYSYGVCPHGIAFEGRGAKKTQAAQEGANSSYYSISLMLGNGEKPTDKQIASVKELRDYLHKQYGNSNVVKGHKDFNSTDCPGTIIYQMIKDGVFSSVSKKSDTELIQEALNKAGRTPKLKVDGIYGPLTTNAVKWFQRKHKLSATGTMNKETRAALFK